MSSKEYDVMAEKSPVISVILPTYNCANFLPHSIQSILSQTYDSYEIIVVDDGSTDNTKEVLNPFMQKIKYVSYHWNKGAHVARNIGIRQALGKYIAFIDADDLWLPEKLQTDVDYLETHPDISMTYSKHINIDSNGNKLGEGSRIMLPSGNIFIQLFSEQNFIITSSVVVRREVFGTTGIFDEQLFNCQDWDMWLRIAYHFKVAGINKLLIKYRHDLRSLSKNRDNVLKYQKAVIDKTYTSFKGKGNGINEKLYKKRLASHHAKVGRYYLRTGNKALALENFYSSLKYNLLNFRTIRYYLYTMFFSVSSR